MNAATLTANKSLLKKEAARLQVSKAVGKSSSGVSARVSGQFVHQNKLAEAWKVLFPELQEIDANGVHYISLEEAEFAGLIEKA